MSEPANEAPFVVMKFGGTSVASIERWHIIANQIRERIEEGLRPVVVCSALAGESDLLEKLLSAAESGEDVRPALGEVAETHRRLAADMGIDADEVVGDLLEELDRLARGARMIEEASPRVRARVMSMGELMSTRLGVAWLETQGIRASWQDAREMLVAQSDPHQIANAPAYHYLAATCSRERDPSLAQRLAALDADVVLTQGFIASDTEGDTVLLGRGGSDTSAAYFAARLHARRLEIWTDVPGLFTSNPRDVPEARLLRRLTYREGEELALMGAKVLHPKCIAPVAEHHIPLHIKWTLLPETIGTIISSGSPFGGPRVKAVSARKGIQLISVDVDRALQNIGFLANTAACFARWNVSIDMVAASESTVTFSLDPAVNQLDDSILEGVMAELRSYGSCRLVGQGAAVSMVGTQIHAILHELGPVFEYLEEHPVYMVSQAADDLNLTIIIGEEDADRLVAQLHGRLFPDDLDDPTFGPTWNELVERRKSAAEKRSAAASR